MQLTESKLIKIIKEELQKVLEQEVLQEESPRDVMKRIIAQTPGGFKGLKKLPFKHPDRVAYRAAYKARRQGKKTFDASALSRATKAGMAGVPTDDVTADSAMAKLRRKTSDADAVTAAVKADPRRAALRRKIGADDLSKIKIGSSEQDLKRKMQAALANVPDDDTMVATPGPMARE